MELFLIIRDAKPSLESEYPWITDRFLYVSNFYLFLGVEFFNYTQQLYEEDSLV